MKFDWLCMAEAARPFNPTQRASWIADQEEHCKPRKEADTRTEDEIRAFEASRKAAKGSRGTRKGLLANAVEGTFWETREGKKVVLESITKGGLMPNWGGFDQPYFFKEGVGCVTIDGLFMPPEEKDRDIIGPWTKD